MVLVSTVTVGSFRLDKRYDIKVVGIIPGGLPPLTAREWFPIPDAGVMLLTAASITLVAFMESIAIAKASLYYVMS